MVFLSSNTTEHLSSEARKNIRYLLHEDGPLKLYALELLHLNPCFSH